MFNSSPTIKYALIVNNRTAWSGGGIVTFSGSGPTIDKSTISDNHAIENGPAIAALYNSSINLKNSIVYRNYFGDYLNGFSEIYKVSSASVNATYSLLRNGTGQTYFGTGCINVNPLFATPGYELSLNSPCIDTGDPAQQFNDPDGTRADMGRYFYEQTGLRGSVAFGSNVSADITFNHISIIVFEGWSDANPIDTLTVNSSGSYYIQLATGGNYRLRCKVNFPLHAAFPNIREVTAIEGQLVNVDPDVNTASFQVNQMPPAYVRGTVLIDGFDEYLDMNTQLYRDISITNNANNDIVHPYPVYDIWGNVIEWRYEATVPADYVWNITLSLSLYQNVTYPVGPIAQNGYWNSDWSEPPHILYPVPFYGSVSGTITLKPDPDFGLPGINITEAIVYWDNNPDMGVHPNPDGTYFLTDVQNNYRTITADHPQLAKISKEKIYVVADNVTEGVDFVMLPWVQAPGNQYVMTAYVTTTLNGDFLRNSGSNIVAAFGEDGTCRGVGKWEQGEHPYWCPDMYFYGSNGYWFFTIVSNQLVGETITFKGYDTLSDEVFYFGNGALMFSDDTHYKYINLVDNYMNYGFSYQLINNWNWISFNRYLPNVNTAAVFAGLNVQEVKNQTQTYTYFDGIGWVGNLHTLNIYNAYKVKMLAPGQLNINGYRINPVIHPMFLDYDEINNPDYMWHWISYLNPEDATLALDDALESITSNVLSVKSQTQSAVNNNGTWIGDLTHMEPGKGYLINIAGDSWLSYPGIGNYSKDSSLPFVPANPAKWDMFSGNTSNMVLIADLGVNERYQAGVFDDTGICRSIGKYENGFWYFTVLGNEMEDLLHIRLFEIEKGEILTSDNSFAYEVNTLLGSVKHPVRFQFDVSDDVVPTAVKLLQNFPNPFNPVTTFSYSIPNDANVKLQIFNVKGQLVDTLVDKAQSASHYQVTWDASKFGTGIYFYQLSVDGKVQEVKKCIMLK
jgi:hypothetical protein